MEILDHRNNSVREKPAAKPTSALERQARQLLSQLDTMFRRMPMMQTDVELAPPDFKALMMLRDKPALTMSDFAEVLGVPLSTATHKVERLVSKGLAERSRVPGDRRLVQVELSAEGKRISRIIVQHRLAFGQSMLAALSRGEREIFLELMAKIASEAKPPVVPKS